MSANEQKTNDHDLDPWKIIKLSNARREFANMSLSDKIWAILHSEEAHYAVIGLLILDVLVVVALITVHIEYMKSQIDDYHNVVQRCKNESPTASCSNQDYGKESLHNAESALFIVSIVILFMFLADNVLQLLAKP
jgi:hypothetical protein